MNNKLWEKSYPKQLKNYQLNESLLSGSVSEFCLYAAQHYQDQPAFSVVLPNGFSQSLSFLCTRQISQNPYPIRVLPS